MNAELAPAIAAAGGGAAALTAILIRERQREEAMRRSRQSLALTFPQGVEPASAKSALASLAGAREGSEFVLDTLATAEGITHQFSSPEDFTASTTAQLGSAMPGLRSRGAPDASQRPTTLVLRVFVPARCLLQTDDGASASRSLLSELARLDGDEQVSVRWALRTGHPRTNVLPDPKSPEERRVRTLLLRRAGDPGFQAAGIVLIRAGSIGRARGLAEHVAGAFRSRRALGDGLRLSYERGNRTLSSLPRTKRSSGWLSTAEVLPLLGWPIGSEWIEGVQMGASRELRASGDLARQGRRLFVARDNRGERPVALSLESAKRHQLAVGPTGTGKSTLIAHGVLDDIDRGAAGVVIDPKNDLVATIADRVPDRHVDRVVLLDPARPGPVPGLDLLGAGDPDLRSDLVLGVLRSIFADAWGPRSDYYGRLALRTLSDVPGGNLLDFGRLFTDAGFRRAAIARQTDPWMLAAWQTYESMSPGEQLQHVQAPVAKVMALISRPALRAVLAQPEPKLDLVRLLSERKWLLVSLAPGTLGEPAARLLGAVLAFMVWAALEDRVNLPPEKRPPVFLVVDELQALTDLPLSIERVAERARGLGGGLVVGTQTISRLPEGTRRALMGNLATLITFRAGADEAARLARELPPLSARDVQSLDAYEVAARVASPRGVSVVTGRTEPLGPVTGNAGQIAQRTAEIYGVDRAEIEARLRDQTNPAQALEEASVGRARRRS